MVGVDVDLSASAGRVVDLVVRSDAGRGVDVACAAASGRFLQFRARQTGSAAERTVRTNASRPRDTERLRSSMSSIVDVVGWEGRGQARVS